MNTKVPSWVESDPENETSTYEIFIPLPVCHKNMLLCGFLLSNMRTVDSFFKKILPD